MRIIKIYETVLNITAKEQYFPPLDAVIIDKLRARYEGKCERNSLIVKITNIVKRSECEESKSRLDGSGDVNVQFAAESIIYNENDILTGCEIQKIERGNNIICKHEIAIITIKGNKNLQSLKPGQKITIRILAISYLKGKDKITIHGVPYSYSYSFMMYLTSLDTNTISFEDIEILKLKIKEIDEEKKLYDQADKTLLKFFNNTYYPFKEKFDSAEKKQLIKESKFEQVDVYDLTIQIIAGDLGEIDENVFLFRHPIIDKSTPTVFQTTESFLKSGSSSELLNPKIYVMKIVNENAAFVLLALLNDHLLYLRMIREMTEIYPTDKELNAHNNIWGIYNKIKNNNSAN